MKAGKKWLAASLVGLAAIAGSIWGGTKAGYIVNTTISAPTGLWRVTATDTRQIERGTLVSVCPPPLKVVEIMRKRGYLKAGRCDRIKTIPLLKPVAAVAGDIVTVEPGKVVQVNGRPVANTTTMAGVPAYPAGEYRIRAGEVWLLSSYDRQSFDSRYFGPVSVRNILGEARPVLVEGSIAAMTGGRP